MAPKQNKKTNCLGATDIAIAIYFNFMFNILSIKISLTHGKLTFNDRLNLILSINYISNIYYACGL